MDRSEDTQRVSFQGSLIDLMLLDCGRKPTHGNAGRDRTQNLYVEGKSVVLKFSGRKKRLLERVKKLVGV